MTRLSATKIPLWWVRNPRQALVNEEAPFQGHDNADPFADGEVFHQIYRGNDTDEQLYQKISDTLTLLATGGDRR